MTEEFVTAIDIGTSKIAAIIAKISEEEKKPRVMGFASVPASGVKRGQIVKVDALTGFFWWIEIDGVHFNQGKVAFFFFGRPDLA